MNKTTMAVLLVSWLSAVPACAQSTRDAGASQNPATPISPPAAVTVDGRDPLVYSAPVLIRELNARTEKGTYLGLTASPVPPVVLDQLRLRPGIGLVVDFVRPESPAAAAGLKQNDIVEKFDDQLLVSIQQLAILVRMHKPGDEVKLSIIREAKPQVVAAKLAEDDVQPLAEITAGGDAAQRYDSALKFLHSPQTIKGGGGTFGSTGGGGGGWQTVSPAKLWAPQQNAAFGIVWSDKEHSFEITQDKDRHLVAKDKSGKVIFDGPISTDEQIEKLPAEIRDKVKKIKVTRLEPPGATTMKSSSVETRSLKSTMPIAKPSESAPRGGV